MLEMRKLSCAYGRVAAVTDLSMSVRAGTVHGLVGPNGAGKTSTIMTVMGHVTQTGGSILFGGQDISRASPDERTELGLGVVPEGRRLFTDMTVEENLTVGGYRQSREGSKRNAERVYELFPCLAERRTEVCGVMSGGEQQMLSFGRALMAEPKLLLVDELSLGLMPKAAGLFVRVLLALKGTGVTVLVVDQNTSRVLRMADDISVMASGQVVFQGSAAECRIGTQLFEQFLGEH